MSLCKFDKGKGYPGIHNLLHGIQCCLSLQQFCNHSYEICKLLEDWTKLYPMLLLHHFVDSLLLGWPRNRKIEITYGIKLLTANITLGGNRKILPFVA